MNSVRTGIRSLGETVSLRWALVRLSEAEQALGPMHRIESFMLARTEVDGETWSYRSGFRFADDVEIRVSRNYVLVTQRCGLDV